MTDSVSGDHYTLTRRAGYTWGPGGATTATPGLAKTVTFKVVTNESTAANLLLTGAVNIAVVGGSDYQRLEQAGLDHHPQLAMYGEMWFNQRPGSALADQRVRAAFTMALNLDQLNKVFSAGTGVRPTQLIYLQPTPCSADTVDHNIPATDVKGANRLLDDAGWTVGSNGLRAKNGKTLVLQMPYTTNGVGASVSAAAEYMTQQLRAIGVQLQPHLLPSTQVTEALTSTGDWDVIWGGLGFNTPAQFVPFVSGAAPPTGTNFFHIENPTYDRLARQASSMQGTSGCPVWNKAEETLIKDSDVVPFSNVDTPYWTSSARVDWSLGGVYPTFVRMTK